MINLLDHVVEIPPIPRELYRKVTFRAGGQAEVLITRNGDREFPDHPVMVGGECYMGNGRVSLNFESGDDIIAIEPITNTTNTGE